MRRAVLALVLIAALPLTPQAAKREGPIDAISMIDYARGPRFKVGDWVRYQTRGRSHQGYRDDYQVVVLIAGEELWWGEKCFWVETQASYNGLNPEITGSLISYSIFDDSLPNLRFGRYVRKFLEGVDDHGNHLQQPFRRSTQEIKNRTFAEAQPKWKTDTLGPDRVEVAKGAFDAIKVRKVFTRKETAQEGDSTVYFEEVENHTTWWSDQVPITRLVKIEQDNVQKRRVWMIGESANAPLNVVEHATGGTELLDYGSGMKSIAIPERFQRPLSEQFPSPARPKARSTGKRG
jgi:hypothetical protein